MSLKSYIVTRALLTIPTVLLLVTIVFLIVRVLPGDPALLHFGKQVNPTALAAVRHSLGLDVPMIPLYQGGSNCCGAVAKTSVGGVYLDVTLIFRLSTIYETTEAT